MMRARLSRFAPFDGDCDRRVPVGDAQQVLGAADDSLAAEDVHAIDDRAPTGLRQLDLEDRSGQARLLASVEGGGGVAARRIAGVELDGDARDQRGDGVETADRQAELLADPAVSVDHEQCGLLQRRA